MKIKALFLIFIVFLSTHIPVNSMNIVKLLSLTKEDQAELIKEQFEKTLDHTNVCAQAREITRRYYQSLKYLKPEETIKLHIFLNDILAAPHNDERLRSTAIKYSVSESLNKAKQRKLKHDNWKKRTLKDRCLNALKNISVTKFNYLCFDLQHKLVEKSKRLDLAHAYAENHRITLPIAQLIVAHFDGTKKVGRRDHLNQVLPPKILQHGNKKILAYALLIQD